MYDENITDDIVSCDDVEEINFLYAEFCELYFN